MKQLVNFVEDWQLNKFLEYVIKDLSWVGEETIVATVLIFKVRIVVHFEKYNTVTLKVNENKPLFLLTFNVVKRKIPIMYRLAEINLNVFNHYDSLEWDGQVKIHAGNIDHVEDRSRQTIPVINNSGTVNVSLISTIKTENDLTSTSIIPKSIDILNNNKRQLIKL